MDRGRDASIVQQLKHAANLTAASTEVRSLLDDTFLRYFSSEAKSAITATILAHPPQAEVIPARTIAHEERRGWAAIIVI